MMTPLLLVEGLRKRFGAHEVLRGIDLEVQRGETLVIIGASGSGKSTLLRCMNFLEIPDGGRVHLDGTTVGEASGKNGWRYREHKLAEVRARVGMVFQHFNLFPHMTAIENVMEGPLSVLGLSRAEAGDRAAAMLQRVGLADKARSYPSRLSGGQQQRVAIARALAMQPMLMLFDEATSALDPELVGEVLQVMRDLKQSGMTMLVVTHELGFAFHAADRVAFLHEGIVHETGTPREVLLAPGQPRTQAFLSSLSQFRLPS